jgi:hypothetical protein
MRIIIDLLASIGFVVIIRFVYNLISKTRGKAVRSVTIKTTEGPFSGRIFKATTWDGQEWKDCVIDLFQVDAIINEGHGVSRLECHSKGRIIRYRVNTDFDKLIAQYEQEID